MFLIKAYFCSVTIFEAGLQHDKLSEWTRGAGLKYKGMFRKERTD